MSTQTQYKRYNIAIIPPAAVTQKAISTSVHLKKSGGVFVLNKRNHFPHITLYAVGFPAKNIRQVRAQLTKLSQTTKPFFMQPRTFRHVYDGYVDIGFTRNRSISNLQKKIIAALNPLRENHLRAKDKLRLKKMPPLERRNIEQFGFYSVGKNFTPHITFTKLGTPNPKVTQTIQPKDFSFVATRIALCEAGEFGTCKKVLKVFLLA